jgi:hypothetical protein
MEKFEEARDKARKNIKLADHLIYVTYGLVKDPKLFLAIMDNIFLALTNSLGALLHFERYYKRIPPFHDKFDSKMLMFKEYCFTKYGFSKEELDFIFMIKDTIISHKKSPVEFRRSDSFVICDDKYHMKSITMDNIKEYLEKTKAIFEKVNSLVQIPA